MLHSEKGKPPGRNFTSPQMSFTHTHTPIYINIIEICIYIYTHMYRYKYIKWKVSNRHTLCGRSLVLLSWNKISMWFWKLSHVLPARTPPCKQPNYIFPNGKRGFLPRNQNKTLTRAHALRPITGWMHPIFKVDLEGGSNLNPNGNMSYLIQMNCIHFSHLHYFFIFALLRETPIA